MCQYSDYGCDYRYFTLPTVFRYNKWKYVQWYLHASIQFCNCTIKYKNIRIMNIWRHVRTFTTFKQINLWHCYVPSIMMMMMMMIIYNGSQISYFSDLHSPPHCSVNSFFVKCCDFHNQIQAACEFTTLFNLKENCFFFFGTGMLNFTSFLFH